MAKVDFSLLKIGNQYTSKELATLWGYQSHHPLVKGMVTPKDEKIIILFVTKEKQAGTVPYEDEIKGNILYMMGQEKHGSDKRLLENLNTSKDEIHLFFRDIHHTPFTYYGKCFLINAKINSDSPSEFEFLLESIVDDFDSEADIVDFVVNIPTQDGEMIPLFVEGAKRITQHVRYERHPFNRKEAIRIQGNKCKICGFDFNEVYGEDIAQGYIEVHHIKQLSEGEQEVNPGKDLLPVCANCHRMLHRKKRENANVAILREVLAKKLYKTKIISK